MFLGSKTGFLSTKTPIYNEKDNLNDLKMSN